MAMRAGETPVLIPNTMVKTCAADGTMLGTAWESRWLPEQNKQNSEWLWKAPYRGCPDGDVAQLGEHLPCKQGVKGSIPSISIMGL